jgi:antitoxin component of MazEF toxin-antitoxin module
VSRTLRKSDKKARIALFADFADQTLLMERVADDEIRIRRVKVVPRKYTLAGLLAGVTPENIHGETDWGPAVGKEVLDGEEEG